MFGVTGEQRPLDRVGVSASRLWIERADPVWWQARTPIGEWQTDDRRTWRTLDGHWLPQVQRSANQCHVFMAIWHDDTYVGFQDDIGWHSATVRSRTRRPHPALRAQPLPLLLAS
jgi:hypothetical protein